MATGVQQQHWHTETAETLCQSEGRLEGRFLLGVVSLRCSRSLLVGYDVVIEEEGAWPVWVAERRYLSVERAAQAVQRPDERPVERLEPDSADEEMEVEARQGREAGCGAAGGFDRHGCPIVAREQEFEPFVCPSPAVAWDRVISLNAVR